MESRRRTWQHEFEARSRDQLQDLLHSLGWVVDPLYEDYGEDLYIRVFEHGNSTGHDFYIQLKGTDKIQKYALKRSPFFSYKVSLANLKQWYDFTQPVIFILWDIEKRIGYWVHMQPLIDQHRQSNQNWLENFSQAKDPKRTIRIPESNILSATKDVEVLGALIRSEYDKTKLGREYYERLHKEHTKAFKSESQPDGIKQSLQLPPNVEQKLLIAQYTASVTADPSNTEAWLGLAYTYYELDDKENALAAINKAWELDKEDPQIINARACTLTEYAIVRNGPKNLFYEAIDLFESLRGKMETAVIEYNIGNGYAGLNENSKAIEHYDKALASDPDSELAAQIWKNRGTAFYRLEDRSEEIHSYQRAIALNPNLWQIYASWAVSEIREKNFVSAVKLFSKAFEVNPDLEVRGHDKIYWFAYSLFMSNDLHQAYSRINQLLSLRPEHENGQLLKAHILSQLWREDPFYIPSAIAFFKNRAINNSDDIFGRGELYLLYNSESNKGGARIILEGMINSDEAPPQVLYHYAMLLEEEQNFDGAIHYLELAYQQSREHHIVHNLARLKQKVGRYRDAIDFYEMALEDVSDPLVILKKIADCYYFLKDFRSCIHVLSKAILLGSCESGPWNNLAIALQELGLGMELTSKFISFLSYNILNENKISSKEIDAELDGLLESKV